MPSLLLLTTFLLLLVVKQVPGAPVTSYDVSMETSFMQTGYGGEGPVSCALCMESMKTTLGYCKDNGGRSVYNIDDVVALCGHIGEEEMRMEDLKSGCNQTVANARSRARVINKKVQCKIIYDAMAHMYSPFDPCNQIRNVVNEPFQVCNSPKVDCNRSLDALYMPSSWGAGPPDLRWPAGRPPHTCPKYVSLAMQACSGMKSQNFYHRSNLEGYCESNPLWVNEPYIVAGCKVVVAKMRSVDSRMDLCSSLHAGPITDTALYCNMSLGIPATGVVQNAEYDKHFERVRQYYINWGLPIPPEYLEGDDTEPAVAAAPETSTNETLGNVTNAAEMVQISDVVDQ